jgi:hypothetical protein
MMTATADDLIHGYQPHTNTSFQSNNGLISLIQKISTALSIVMSFGHFETWHRIESVHLCAFMDLLSRVSQVYF